MGFRISRQGRITAQRFTKSLAAAFRGLPIDSEPSVRFQAVVAAKPKPDKSQ